MTVPAFEFDMVESCDALLVNAAIKRLHFAVA
jgi:hypothetical protein